MNWDALGALAQAVGSVGVILTLIYLAVQTKHNTRILEQTGRAHEAATYRANIDGVMNLQAVLAQDSRLALIWKKGLANESLTEEEVSRFEAYLTMFLFDIEYKLYLLIAETASLSELGGMDVLDRHIKGQIEFIMRSELARTWWRANSDRTFGEVFVAEVNRIANL
jgi:hypothetical protein